MAALNHVLANVATATMETPSRIKMAVSMFRASLLFAVCFAFHSFPVLAAPPNVVMILSDDQAWTDYGFMGHPHIQTPNLDRLASQSLVFTRGYVPDSLCRPSLASIITGMYPQQHKIVGNDPPFPASLAGLKPAERQKHPEYLEVRDRYIDHMRHATTICKRLQPLGYEMLQTGKWWEGNWSVGGFTQGMTHGDMKRGARHGDVGLEIGRQGMGPIPEFLDQAKSSQKPFLLWYAPMLPHTPHNPPERLAKKYLPLAPTKAIADYWAMCEWWDETIGDLMKLLDDRGLAENTIVVYVTDNGWINDPAAAKYAPRSKRSQYDGGIRTPIMVRWPAKVSPHRDDEHLASSIDLVPTIMAACGLKPDPALSGINLMDSTAVGKRNQVYGGIFEHDIVSMTDPTASLMWRWSIRDNMKLIVPNPARCPNDIIELYDLKNDPTEQTTSPRTIPSSSRNSSNRSIVGMTSSDVPRILSLRR